MNTQYHVLYEEDGTEFHMKITDGELTDEEIDLLTPDKFSYLGDWQSAMFPTEIGTIYRIGLIDNLRDSDGDKFELHFYFGLPIASRGRGMTEDEIQLSMESLRDIAKDATASYSREEDVHVRTYISTPPSYMIDELRKSGAGNVIG